MSPAALTSETSRMVVQTCRSSKGDPERQAEAGGTAESVERNPLFFKARERRKSSTLFLFGQCGAAAISFSHLVSLLLRSPFGRLSPPLSSRSCPLSGLPLPTDEPNPRNADEKPQEKKKKKKLAAPRRRSRRRRCLPAPSPSRARQEGPLQRPAHLCVRAVAEVRGKLVP